MKVRWNYGSMSSKAAAVLDRMPICDRGLLRARVFEIVEAELPVAKIGRQEHSLHVELLY